MEEQAFQVVAVVNVYLKWKRIGAVCRPNVQVIFAEGQNVYASIFIPKARSPCHSLISVELML